VKLLMRRITAYDHLGISFPRILLLAASSSLVGAGGAALALGGVLGVGTAPTLFVVGVLVFYIVLSAPRRILDGRRVAQSREAVMLSASSLACLGVTRSKARTALMLRSRNPSLSRALDEIGRRVLLGSKVESAVAGAAGGLESYSAVAALQGVATLTTRAFDAGDEETRGLASSTELARETKLPIFMTACFFTPVMLLLFAIFSHTYSPLSLAELVAFEFVILDLTFYLSAGEKGVH
jgi:hypothetical protein